MRQRQLGSVLRDVQSQLQVLLGRHLCNVTRVGLCGARQPLAMAHSFLVSLLPNSAMFATAPLTEASLVVMAMMLDAIATTAAVAAAELERVEGSLHSLTTLAHLPSTILQASHPRCS